MPHTTLCLPITFAATEFVGFIRSIERRPDRWDWPQSTLDYLRFRLHELTVEMLAAEVAVAS
jgi:hypothetical protein